MTRLSYVMTTYFTVMGVAIASFVPTPVKLIWNASASTPVGLYSIGRADHLKVTDIVAVDASEPLVSFMVERGYIARGVPLMKRVAALPGQQVCRTGRDVMVDGAFYGAALDRDNRGRELPVWHGCHRIADGEIFLMNGDVRDSLDGRYFGPVSVRSIIGRATPVWTDEGGDGRFEWRAGTR